MTPHLSVVVPAYGNESRLRPLYDALTPVLASISPAFEIVMVDDHSPQGDWSVICELAAKDPRVRGVKLTRKFGHHCAIAAGLAEANGAWVVVMRCELDRPQDIPRLYAKAKEGFECVFGRGTFSIISHRVVRELRKVREGRRNYEAEVTWLGFPTARIEVEASSHVPNEKIRERLANALSQSTRPLYASAVLGLAMALGAVGVAIYFVIRKLTVGSGVEGWTSVIVSLFFLFGMLFLNMGVLGLYLGSVFNEVKGRPPFVIERTTYEDQS